MHCVDQMGKTIILGKKLGGGGEGAVYEISGTSEIVAKVYHQPATREKAAKLAAMDACASPHPSASCRLFSIQTKKCCNSSGGPRSPSAVGSALGMPGARTRPEVGFHLANPAMNP